MYEALWIVSIAALPLILFGLRVREIYLSNRWRPATAKITACYKATIVDVENLFVDVEFVLDGVHIARLRLTRVRCAGMASNLGLLLRYSSIRMTQIRSS